MVRSPARLRTAPAPTQDPRRRGRRSGGGSWRRGQRVQGGGPRVRPQLVAIWSSCRVCVHAREDRKSTRLNSSHSQISYAVFCLKKKNSVKQLTLFSRISRITKKRNSKHSAMLMNIETRHIMFIRLLNTTRTLT